MKNTILLMLVLSLLLGCSHNKIVFVSVDQEAQETNTLTIDDSALETDDRFEGDSQPVIELPLIP